MKESYKNTEFGRIPSDWKIVKLNKVFSRITTKNKEGNNNVLTISAQYGLINQEQFFNKTVASKNNSNYYLLEKGDFAYNKSYSNGYPMGAIKKLEYYDKGIVSPLYICFRLEDENSDKEFYQYYFEHNIFDRVIASIAQEGARNHGLLNVSVTDFFELPVLKPNLNEQQKIAEILSTVDSQIDDTDKIIEKTKELKKGLMQKLLTKGIGHKEFKKTDVGEIPVEWEVYTMGDVSTFINGRAYKQTEFKEKGTPIIRIQNLTGEGKYVYSDLNLSEDKYIENGDLIYAWSATFGPFIWDGDRGIYHYHIWKIECKKELILKEFYYYRLNYISNEMENMKNGSAFSHITKGFMENHKIALPKLYEQQKIADILSSVDNEIEQYESKKAKLEELKKGLMQQLLTGKIRVV